MMVTILYLFIGFCLGIIINREWEPRIMVRIGIFLMFFLAWLPCFIIAARSK